MYKVMDTMHRGTDELFGLEQGSSNLDLKSKFVPGFLSSWIVSKTITII